MLRTEPCPTLALAFAVPNVGDSVAGAVNGSIGFCEFEVHGVGVVWVQVLLYRIPTAVDLTVVGTAETVKSNTNSGGAMVSAESRACQ